VRAPTALVRRGSAASARALQRLVALGRPLAWVPDLDGAAGPDNDPGGAEPGRGPAQALAERLPPAVRGGRLAVDGRAVAGLAVLALLSVGLAVGYVVRGRPVGVAPPTRVPVVDAARPGPSAPVGSGSAAATLVVHVAGTVRRPGLVTVPAGSRVDDAVRAAGGALPGTDLAALNLARPLVDGEQVVVGSAGGSGAGGRDPADPGRLDLNTATLDQLEGLPGVGPVLAQRILDWRSAHGRFSSVDELREVGGIGERKFADIAPRVRV